jgi:hypothetical protein
MEATYKVSVTYHTDDTPIVTHTVYTGASRMDAGDAMAGLYAMACDGVLSAGRNPLGRARRPG